RSLQRIDRGRASESATLARRSLSLRNQHISIARSRDCAFHHQQVLVEIDTAHAQVANRYLVGAKVTRHPLARKHARRKARCADRHLHLEHMTVRLGTTAESVPANDACKTAALRRADHIHKLRFGKDVDQHTIASLDALFAFSA